MNGSHCLGCGCVCQLPCPTLMGLRDELKKAGVAGPMRPPATAKQACSQPDKEDKPEEAGHEGG